MTGSFQADSMVRGSVSSINRLPRASLPMLRTFCFWGILALLLAPLGWPPGSRAQDADGLARIEGFLAGLRSLRAHVAQRYHDRAHGRDVDSEGELALSRPDRLTLRFASRGLALVGAQVTAVDDEAGWVHERSLRDDTFPELRALLSGSATLAATFDVRSLGARASGEVLEVRPRSRALFDRALVSVGEDGIPTRILVVDVAGNTLRWVFSAVRTSATLPAGALALPLPEGARVISP